MIRHRHRSKVRGVTLLELIAVVVLLGIIGTVTVASYRRGTISNVSAKTDATRVLADLRLARQRAIATGDNHFLSFGMNGSSASYTVQRRLSNGTTQITSAEYVFYKDVTVTVTPSNPEFTFEGDGLAGYTITLRGADRVYQITVNRVTGAARITAL